MCIRDSPTTDSDIANAANLLASLADFTFDNPFIPKASKSTAKRSMTNLMITGRFILTITFYLMVYD